MAELKPSELNKYLKPGRLLAPVAIGLGVATFMLVRNFDLDSFKNIRWTWYSTWWLSLSFLMVVIRDLAYMIRIRVLTENELSWRKSFDVIMLWEFASALAPAILGGGFAFAILIINREKINLGKSISVVLFTSFLDGMFFALVAPIIYYGIGRENLFSSLDPNTIQQLSHGGALNKTFWIIYFVLLAYKLFVGYALFINARAVKSLLLRIFNFKPLRRWKFHALQTGTEMVIASKELKRKKFSYWFWSFAATCLSWSARFILINCLIKAFSQVDINHALLYARQVVIGILMIGSPTPGGSGIAEVMFSNFLGEFIDNKSLTSSLALLWRLISYYPYIFIGAIILPRWLARVVNQKNA
jgi:uncharacterized protein (TIRG00374 family)